MSDFISRTFARTELSSLVALPHATRCGRPVDIKTAEELAWAVQPGAFQVFWPFIPSTRHSRLHGLLGAAIDGAVFQTGPVLVQR